MLVVVVAVMAEVLVMVTVVVVVGSYCFPLFLSLSSLSWPSVLSVLLAHLIFGSGGGTSVGEGSRVVQFGLFPFPLDTFSLLQRWRSLSSCG